MVRQIRRANLDARSAPRRGERPYPAANQFPFFRHTTTGYSGHMVYTLLLVVVEDLVVRYQADAELSAQGVILSPSNWRAT
jgi:hypothetical protein